MSTYQERVLRFRVLRQLVDAERNPEGLWSLVYSTNDPGNAEEFAAHEREGIAKFNLPDLVKVVDNGEETVIEREVW